MPDRALLWPLLLFAILVAGSLTVRDAYFNYLLKLAALNIIVTCGLNLLMGYAGQAFIAVAATFAIGAYGSALAMMQFGFPFVVAWIAGALLAGVFGVVSGVPAFRLAGAYLAMVSIAFNVVIEEVLIHWATVTGGPVGLTGIPAPAVAGYALGEQAAAALATVAAAGCWLLVETLRRSPWGLALVAMRESEVAARSLGVDTVRLKAVVFFISACVIGLGGGLYSHSIKYISPDIGTIFASIIFVLMLILGGLGTAWGPIIGAITLTVVPQLLSEFQRYHLIVLGGILLGLIVLMPRGIAAAFGGRHLAKPRRATAATAGEAVSWQPAPGQRLPLTVSNLQRAFGGIAALRGVSLTVEPGQIRGLIGPNGSGKSTFVNVVTGLYSAQGGSVRFGDRDLTGAGMTAAARAGIVRTFQTPQLFRELTVRENLEAAQFPRHAPGIVAAAFGLPASRRRRRENAARADAIAARIGLAPFLDRPAGELPQGEQRKLEIARALAAEPAVLILDEPAAGLSAAESETLCELLEYLRAQGLALLLIEHHMDLIMRVCDRITVLDRGETIAEGTPAEVQRDARVRLAYLGTERAVRATPRRPTASSEIVTTRGL